MNFSLKPDQEQFIQQELEAGRYADADEVIATALELLKQQSQYEQWAKEVGEKIDIAAAQLDRGEGIDGEVAVARLKERLHQRNV
jgi:antitoxin ParD1/3/4